MDQYQYEIWLLHEINRVLAWQTNKIAHIEAVLNQIQDQLSRLDGVSRTHVEKIEYNFEQLKVDRLDGTLVIGISPLDTGMIDDLDIQDAHVEDMPLDHSSSADPSPNNQPMTNLQEQIYNNVCDYIRGSISDKIDEQAAAQNLAVQSADKASIITDMIRQVDDRIRSYLQHYRHHSVMNENELEVQVVNQVKQDIDAAIDHYLEYFRGGNPHE
jgi:spore germination protein PC